MSINAGSKTQNRLPTLDGGALDLAKLLAAVLMLVDHINTVVLARDVPLMFFIGRTAFPLFCYAVAVAVSRTTPERLLHYVTRMLLLAFACDVVVMPVFYPDAPMANVLFTLSFGAVFAFFAQNMKPAWRQALYALAILSLFVPHSMEYGLMGVALPSAMLHAMRGERHASLWAVALCLTVNAHGIATSAAPVSEQIIVTLLIGLAAAMAFVIVRNIDKHCPAGKRFLPRYALYVFYPAHVVLLAIIARFIA